MVIVTLQEMYPRMIGMEPRGEKEIRVFSTMQKAELWLKANGFYYGQRSFFNYRDGAQEWCHEKEFSWNYVKVTITEHEADDGTESKYKNL